MINFKILVVKEMLCVVIASSALLGEANAKPREGMLSQVNCECTCAVRREGRSPMIEDKTFAAPGGDPQRCGGMNNTSCRNTRPDGTTALGKLEDCSAVVTMRGGSRPALPDEPMKIAPTPDDSTSSSPVPLKEYPLPEPPPREIKR
ncbi:hypothetical protein [Solemya elarraichensis gill symbiont]|uniref:hypothetical protein n=1 Tax=Solemya elarraichensis gill symbiont TaxID=1918949 RepID=UPI000998E851|nr:hypothetical protein [Solemya elarraichensis gill symbiont]